MTTCTKCKLPVELVPGAGWTVTGTGTTADGLTYCPPDPDAARVSNHHRPVKTYRVHVHDQRDQGRWLASADFPRVIPHPDAIAAALPVLGTPGGRYEVRVNLLTPAGEELHRSGWTQDGPPVRPVDPELFAATAPAWNCVAYPGEGMHYLDHAGNCRWCGMTRAQIGAERTP